MVAFDSQIGKYHVTARLFNFIHDLPEEKQFILYKQLIKDDVKTQIFKLIIDLSDEKKVQLLERLGDAPFEEEPVRTITLDEEESFMREIPRKICSIVVKCMVNGHSFKSLIINISTVGAFIETHERFETDQQVLMSLKLPNYHKALELKGRIARSGPKGIGVKFYGLTPAVEEIIHHFIETKQ